MTRKDILYVLDKLNISNILPQKNDIQINCPLAPFEYLHKKTNKQSGLDRHPSMGISLRKKRSGINVVNCFTCKFNGNIQDLIGRIYRYKLIDNNLANHLLQFISNTSSNSLDEIIETIPPYIEKLPENNNEEKIFGEEILDPYKNKTHKYILNRGLHLNTVKYWEGGFDNQKNRVIFPVRNWIGNLVGLVGRTVKNELPSYYNYWSFNKGKILFGEDKIKKNTIGIITEGLLDVLFLWQYLSGNELLLKYSPVALLGSKATKDQIQKIVQLFEDVILFFDNDPPGQEGQKILGKQLYRQLLVKEIKYPINYINYDPAKLVQSDVDIFKLLNNSTLFI